MSTRLDEREPLERVIATQARVGHRDPAAHDVKPVNGVAQRTVCRRVARWGGLLVGPLRLAGVCAFSIAGFVLAGVLGWRAVPPVSAGHESGGPVVEIELDVFSGRPNPTWRLSEEDSRQLLALLDDLPPAPPLPPGALGYRGFVIHRPRAAGASVPALRVFAGTVEIDSQPHADLRGAEAWLMRSAREQGWAAVVDSIPAR